MADNITSNSESLLDPVVASAVTKSVEGFRASLDEAAVDLFPPLCRGNGRSCYSLGRGVVLDPVGMAYDKKNDTLARTSGLAIARFGIGIMPHSAHMVDWAPNDHLHIGATFPLAMLGRRVVQELLDRTTSQLAAGTYAEWATDRSRFRPDIRIPMQRGSRTAPSQPWRI